MWDATEPIKDVRIPAPSSAWSRAAGWEHSAADTTALLKLSGTRNLHKGKVSDEGLSFRKGQC